MEIYHALNRGVEKRDIFLDDQDRARFVHDMYEFNKVPPTHNVRRTVVDSTVFDIVSRTSEKRLVDIHGWCLMKNHYHLIISERIDGGRALFLRRLNIGYAKYFNEKYKRSGFLFQGRTKKILVAKDAHFLHILHYVHLNPLDFLKGAGEWRRGSIAQPSEALAHLEAYRWSSYRDYCGTKNFPSIITTKLFGGVFGDYEKTIKVFMRDLTSAPMTDLRLE